MPDVNLLKDTRDIEPPMAPRPAAAGDPELTNPSTEAGKGLGGIFKSLFNRGPKTLPIAPASPAATGGDRMSVGRRVSTDRVLSETRKARPAVIPLPEEDEGGFNVNLLSADMVAPAKPRQRAIQLALVLVASMALVGLVYGGLIFYQNRVNQTISTTQKELAAVKSRIASLNKNQEEIVATTQKIEAIRALIDRHTRWTKFFSLLEKYTLPTVTYGPSFDGDISGTLALSATTTSYEEIARQYLVFKQLTDSKTFISSFNITGANRSSAKDGEERYSFSVTMQLLPDVFTQTLAATNSTQP